MPTMTLSLPASLNDWVESRAQDAGYRGPDDYVLDLIRRDRERREAELSLDDLRSLVRDAKASGTGDRTVAEIFEAARRAARQP